MQHSDARPAAELPTTFKLLLLFTLIAIALGAIWNALVCCLNLPPGTWRLPHAASPHHDNTPAKDPQSINKHTGITDDENDAIELRTLHSKRHRADARSSNTKLPTATSLQRTSTERASNPSSSQHTLSVCSSPENPFLDPPGVKREGVQGRVYRSSREWKEAHAAFFGYSEDTAALTVVGAEESAKQCEAGVEVQEAGAAGLREEEDKGGKGGEREEDGVANKGFRLLGYGLGVLDGAVDAVVARMARWMDDERGD